VAEIWRVMVLVIEALRAALSFMPLHEIPRRLPRFLDHLARPNSHTRPRAVELFVAELRPEPG
jgi:hypothetical protein